MEFRKFYAKIKFGISAHFFRKKRRERGNLSVKMDSRFRGNDGGEAGICRRESDGGGGGGIRKKRRNSPQKNPPQFPPKKNRHSRRKQEKTPVIPAKAGIHFEEQNCEFTSFFHNGGNDGNLSAKMDSRFRGNDSGEAGFCRRKLRRRGRFRFTSEW